MPTEPRYTHDITDGVRESVEKFARESGVTADQVILRGIHALQIAKEQEIDRKKELKLLAIFILLVLLASAVGGIVASLP